MLNQVVFVGRLTKDPEIIESEDGKKRTRIIIAVNRGFKNIDGVYETDFIPCTLWNAIAENTCEYCKKGDIIGVKGRIQTSNYENEEGEKIYTTEVIAEKITFLSSSKSKEQDNKNEM